MPTYECEWCFYSTANKGQHARHLLTKKHLLTYANLPDGTPGCSFDDDDDRLDKPNIAEDWETKYNALLVEFNALFHKERALNTIVRGCLAYID
jgi:hypothetical protein